MARVAKRLLSRSALPCGCALAALSAAPAAAQSDARLFTPDTVELTGDVRLVAVDGERSWLDGGSASSARAARTIARPSRARQRQPQMAAAIQLVAVGDHRRGGPGRRPHRAWERGVPQLPPDARQRRRFLRPRRPDVATRGPEHEGADWHVGPITPSTIDSWIGEEVKPVASKEPGATLASRGARPRRHGRQRMVRDLARLPRLVVSRPTTLAFGHQLLPPLEGPNGENTAPNTHTV